MDELGTLTMSATELNRLEILGRLLEWRLTKAQAAVQLGLSLRHVERLWRVSEWMGAKGSFQRNAGDRVIGSCPQRSVSALWCSSNRAMRTSVRPWPQRTRHFKIGLTKKKAA